MALAIQGLTLVFMLGGVVLTEKLIQARPTFLIAALMQGGIAALVSHCFKLARWWVAIQLIFPVALLAAYSFHLPPNIFLAAFIFFLLLYWTTFRTQVPFYPSGPSVWKKVAELLPQDRPVRFIDIGSGLGDLVLHIAQQRPDGTFSGIEVAPLPWLVSWIRAALCRSRGRFICGDYENLDFAQYDVVFAYLSPAAMPALWKKAVAEMRPGALLLSYEFPIAGPAPKINMAIEPRGTVLFGWYF